MFSMLSTLSASCCFISLCLLLSLYWFEALKAMELCGHLAVSLTVATIDAIPHILAVSICFSWDVILSQRGIRDSKGTRPPSMGPALHNAVVRPAYDNAILYIINKDYDGNIWERSTHQSTQTSKSHPKAAMQTGKTAAKCNTKATPQPPTAASLAKAKTQDKLHKDRLAHNQQDIKAHSMDVFFPDNPPNSPAFIKLSTAHLMSHHHSMLWEHLGEMVPDQQ
ncbi:hypothetical protein K439DRAFT_1625072 [Ramaria rubella]|nr:hypothetical protein K439DRAFT_1625072 [Ramaria rubella]